MTRNRHKPGSLLNSQDEAIPAKFALNLFRALCSLGLFFWVLAYCFGSGHWGVAAHRTTQAPEVLMNYTPALSLSELATCSPFTATVISRSVAVSKGLKVQQAGDLFSTRDAVFTNLVIHVTKDDGAKVAISEQDANAKSAEFALSLRIGGKYTFPKVFNQWMAGTNYK